LEYPAASFPMYKTVHSFPTTFTLNNEIIFSKKQGKKITTLELNTCGIKISSAM
jgi:hypothetical protein